MIDFGAGNAWLNPIGGNLAANPTPAYQLTMQSASIKFNGSVAELMGNSLVADDVATKDLKITGDITVGRVDFESMNQTFFAGAKTAGTKQMVYAEAHAIPATAPYTITVAPPNSGTFVTDLGVTYASGVGGVGNGKFQRVTGTPTVGQYAVSAGVYTFAAADEGVGVLISYDFSQPTAGNTYTLNANTVGYGPICELYLMETYQSTNSGLTGGIHLFAVRITGVTMDRKRDGYNTPKLEWQAFANPARQIAEFFDPGL